VRGGRKEKVGQKSVLFSRKSIKPASQQQHVGYDRVSVVKEKRGP